MQGGRENLIRSGRAALAKVILVRVGSGCRVGEQELALILLVNDPSAAGCEVGAGSQDLLPLPDGMRVYIYTYVCIYLKSYVSV